MLSWLPLDMKTICLEAHRSSSANPALKVMGLHMLTQLWKLEQMAGKLLDKICISEQYGIAQHCLVTWGQRGFKVVTQLAAVQIIANLTFLFFLICKLDLCDMEIINLSNVKAHNTTFENQSRLKAYYPQSYL